MPFTTHGRTDGGLVHPYHDFDNEAYAHQAVQKLVSRGRKRIALLQPPSKLTYYTHTRIGFQTGLHDYGAEEVPLRVNIDAPLAEIRDAVEQMMRSPGAPDGIVSSAGSATIAVNAGIEAAGKRLGHDVDLVSKQSAPILNWIRPEIIAAYEDVRHAGREMAKQVIARIDGVDAELLQSISKPEWPNGR
jgi:LacI family transcriptional regulator